MCSLQHSSEPSYGVFTSELIEDDFITNFFGQHVPSNYLNQCPDTTINKSKANHVVPAENTWIMPNQIDHDCAYTESSTMLSPVWEQQTAVQNVSSLNMSKYFSTFDPSIQLPSQPAYQAQNCAQSTGKRQQAPLKFVSTAARNLKTIVKRKRKRTVFRTDQIEAMEEVFAKKPYITREDRMVLVKQLQISDKSIKVWFQNRRLKNRRNDEEHFDDEEGISTASRLDYVESEIRERTDEFGFVSLDNSLISDLFEVIEDCLSNISKKSSNETVKTEATVIPMEETQEKVESIPFYEPISPASTTDCSYEGNPWECQYMEQNDSLQRLVDIHSIIINE